MKGMVIGSNPMTRAATASTASESPPARMMFLTHGTNLKKAVPEPTT